MNKLFLFTLAGYSPKLNRWFTLKTPAQNFTMARQAFQRYAGASDTGFIVVSVCPMFPESLKAT
ncbi:MAG: hypothetical protein R3E73_12210 [Porticoccaceae bacterium]|nr:hypothetical protein [Pseudomonadales bacterium]